jgi:hypothetical protein
MRGMSGASLPHHRKSNGHTAAIGAENRGFRRWRRGEVPFGAKDSATAELGRGHFWLRAPAICGMVRLPSRRPTSQHDESNRGSLVRRALLLALAAALISASPAGAQYFGRNKVQYDDLDFRVLGTPHFDIYYYPAEREAARRVGRMAERWYGRIAAALDHTLASRTPIVLYASRPHFAQTTVIPGAIAEGVGGFTDHRKGRVVLPFAASLGETDHVLGHELVHAFQRDALKQHGRSIALLPLWFVEGMAEYLSIGRVDANTAMWVRDALRHDRMPTVAQLQDPRWFPYRYGQALWAYLAERYGEAVVARALTLKARHAGIGQIVAAAGVPEPTLSREWHAWLRRRFLPDGTAAADDSRLIVGPAHGGGRLNVGPALSPDGKRLVFVSERGHYSMDVFVADAASGMVERKIVSTAGDPHFDSLQFIDSSGTWDPSGERFAFAALRKGRPVLTILDMRSGQTWREHVVAGLDQIFDPSWSPDGRRLVFAALQGGTSDLYVADAESGALTRLTDDPFADLQPAWAPDGRRIAFVTDRFTSSLDDLTFGPYRLATIDVGSGAVAPLPSVDADKNIDPQWAGDDLYFLADPGGVTQVFRWSSTSPAIEQITAVPDGVSGITALSPALSISPAEHELAFSVYSEGNYAIRGVDLERTRADRTPPTEPSVAFAEASVQPSSTVANATIPDPQPAAAPRDPLAAAASLDGGKAAPRLQAPAPPATGFQSRPYASVLRLDALGQPYLSAGGGALGGFLRAGTSFTFGDLLERHQIHTAIQVGARLRDFALQTAYVNRTSRWNWGILAGQLPTVLGSTRTFVNPAIEGSPQTISRETSLYEQIHRQAAVMAAYPFDQAHRLEFSLGFHRIAFNRESRTRRYDAASGLLIDTATSRGVAGDPATLLEASAAFVRDTAVFGASAPVVGSRARFEIAPTFGDVPVVTLTADYRRYFMPRSPLTIAMRVEHVGRYGAGASDPRLLPLVWTLRDLVRGYSTRDAAGLADAAARGLLVGNLELRLPVIGSTGVVSRRGGPPIDAIAFADLGRFWASGASAATLGPSVLRSVGAGARLNVGGFIFEFDAVRPLAASRGWTLAVNFRPGF